jgi:hypothetical protein
VRQDDSQFPAPDYAARRPVAWTMIHFGHARRGETGVIIEDRGPASMLLDGYAGRLQVWLAGGLRGHRPDPGCQQDHRGSKWQPVQDGDGSGGYLALHIRGCRWGLKPPVSSSDLAM